MTTPITATVELEGKWWAVALPIDGKMRHTQGKSLKDAQVMAEDLLALWAEELHQPALAHAPIRLEIVGEAGQAAAAVELAKAEADKAAANVRKTQEKAVRDLRARGVKLTDIAQIIGVTKGRISQLVNA